MAKAKKLPSGNWRCLAYDYTDEKGKRHYKSFTAKAKKEAEYLAAEYALNKNEIKNRELTFGEALESYISQREAVLSPLSIREYKRLKENDLKPLSELEVDGLTQEQIQTFINNYSKTMSPKSVRCTHGLIASVLKDSRPNFALNTTMPKQVRPNLHIPSDSEVKELLDLVKGTEMEIVILLGAFGPMRRGEICALDSDHIKGDIVHVEFNMVLNLNNEWILKAPKSIAGNRYIKFPDFVIDKIKDIDGRIVKLNPSQVSSRFKRLIKRSNLPHFRLHDLRHYGASILHALGMPDQYILARGGWETDTTLKQVYRHTMDKQEKEINDQANQYFDDIFSGNATRNATQKNKTPENQGF